MLCSPDCTHKHMLENGAPPDKFGALYRLLHIEFHGFNSSIDVSGLSQFGSCVNSIFLREGMGPFKCCNGEQTGYLKYCMIWAFITFQSSE